VDNPHTSNSRSDCSGVMQRSDARVKLLVVTPLSALCHRQHFCAARSTAPSSCLAVATSGTFVPIFCSSVVQSCKQFKKCVSYNTSKMRHGWPNRKQLTIINHDNTSVVKLKRTSAIVGSSWQQVSWIWPSLVIN
jgi:hypothetical protein